MSAFFLGNQIRWPSQGVVPAGWEEAENNLRFPPEGLFQYINGGAELFLEFGFEELEVRRYTDGSKEIELDIYRMESRPSALGVYLQKCGRETPHSEIRARNSFDPYQCVVVKDRYFFMINNFKGEKDAIPVMVAMANFLTKSIPDSEEPPWFQLLPDSNRIPGTERLFRGPFGLQPIYTFGAGDILSQKGEIFGVAADYSGPSEDRLTRLVIDYSDDASAGRAYLFLQKNLDPYLKILEKDSDVFSFEDDTGRFGLVRKEGGVMTIFVHLTLRPSLNISE
jgi:hypothetical protein